jgi:hypothetical protein
LVQCIVHLLIKILLFVKQVSIVQELLIFLREVERGSLLGMMVV